MTPYSGFLTIAITSPDFVEGEAARISEILRNGEADIVHIRKPGWDEVRTELLIREIPADLYPRLKFHDHFQLLSRFPLAGVHLNSRNPEAPANAASVSISFHSIEQLDAATHYDYVTLSPVFDSISKTGYRSAFSLKEIAPVIKGKRVVALGGVTPDRIPLLRDAGFFGAAMLGYFWK